MQKKLLIFAVVVLVLIGGAVFVWQKKTSQEIPQSEVKNTGAKVVPEGWKIYRDENLGFEMALPQNFEKTEQGFTPLNPPVGNPESLENNVWFEVEEKKSEYWKDFSGIKVQNLSDDDFVYPAEKKYRKSGALEVSFERKKVNGIYLVVVSSLQKKEPDYDTGGGWIEGGWKKEVFFDCKDSICLVAIYSHSYSKEKESLLSTVIETLKY